MKKLVMLIGALGFLFLSSCASVKSTNAGDSNQSLRVYIFECGENDVNDLSIFAPGIGKNISKKFTVSCYVIKHPRGILLWDSGLSDEIAQQQNGVSAKGGKFHLRVKKPFLEQLKNIGIAPQNIGIVAYSHFHADHVGNANAFKSATLLIQEEEYDAAFGKKPEQFGFDPKTYAQLKDKPVIKLSGDHDVFQDGSVIIKRAIGHTPGHQMLFIDLPKTGPVILSGDLYHFTDNRINQRVPTINFDAQETKKSMAAIEDFVQKTKATMWIQHDYEQNQTLRHAPEFYE